MENVHISDLLRIGISLSTEKDVDKLLETILNAAMDITACDGGTLYIRDGELLRFQVMMTRSKGLHRGGRGDAVELPPVPMNRGHMCAQAVLEKRLVNIPNTYLNDAWDFSGTRQYDALNDYRTVSTLVVPMTDQHEEAIGVMQLINAMDGNGEVIPFSPQHEAVISSLASQAAITLNNRRLAQEVEELLHSFVRVMSTAIDMRSPYNANHTRNMARYADGFISWLNESGNDWRFTQAERDQFLMSVWLHDVGKLVTPLEIMDKRTRLGNRENEVFHRLEVAGLQNELELLRGRQDEAAFQERRTFLEDARSLIQRVNGAGFLSDSELEGIKALEKQTFRDASGTERPLLTEDELDALCVRKGTLTDEERRTMESHVTMTEKMLSEMTFSRSYSKVPQWAAAHHEYINGTGYPHRLKGGSLPREVRLLTILDIFEALTARDRPYKPPMPAEKAFSILESMAQEGKLDADILALFKASGRWTEGEELP